jgi:hypothetical protein
MHDLDGNFTFIVRVGGAVNAVYLPMSNLKNEPPIP